MAGVSKVPWPDLWKGLLPKADDTAVAEHALRFIARAQARPWTKSDILEVATAVVAQRWGGYCRRDIHNLVRADPAVRRAFDRLVAAGAINWVKRRPLIFNL